MYIVLLKEKNDENLSLVVEVDVVQMGSPKRILLSRGVGQGS